MLEITRIREQTNAVKEGLRKRMWTEEQISIIDKIIEIDEKRREAQQKLDVMLSESNNISKEIGRLFAKGKKDEAEILKEQVGKSKDERKEKDKEHQELVQELNRLLYEVPNVPDILVKAGKDEKDNEVFQDFNGTLPKMHESSLPHWELADRYKLMNLELGVRVTGAGFPVFTGNGARMQRALVQYFLDKGREAGYLEIQPPILVSEDSAMGAGQLPDKDGQMYYIEKDDLYVIPTAEVPLMNLYRNEMIDINDFPIKLMGYTPCFRREAGSYGAHVKGLNRVHQFDKVEIVQIVRPEVSDKVLMEMCGHVGNLLESLHLPYRILRLCGGDTGFASAITYDFEIWSIVQERWLEVSSVSNIHTFQTNRMKLRFKNENGESVLAHSLNGSALALPRILAGLWEINQIEHGINIPKVLQSYMGGMELIS